MTEMEAAVGRSDASAGDQNGGASSVVTGSKRRKKEIEKFIKKTLT
jgi:hypothetical protein